MPARLHLAAPLVDGAEFSLPDGAARHVQVLRLQPGDACTVTLWRNGATRRQAVTLVESDD